MDSILARQLRDPRPPATQIPDFGLIHEWVVQIQTSSRQCIRMRAGAKDLTKCSMRTISIWATSSTVKTIWLGAGKMPFARLFSVERKMMDLTLAEWRLKEPIMLSNHLSKQPPRRRRKVRTSVKGSRLIDLKVEQLLLSRVRQILII